MINAPLSLIRSSATFATSSAVSTKQQNTSRLTGSISARGAVCDKKAEEIVSRLDYDFSLADKDTAMHSGVIARTIVLDRLTTAWLAAYPGGIVVNIACGLDTRCYRMKGYAHWYNLDLPETMAVRAKLLSESGLISQIAMSAMDNWVDEIKEKTVPVLVIIEGLTMYLSEADVQRIFAVISGRFQKDCTSLSVGHDLRRAT